MVLEKLSLAGKVAIVTGGGTGIGRAIALALARAGADIVVASRRMEFIEKAAAEISALGRRAVPVPTDVTSSEQVDRMVKRALDEFGRIDILVNNAGIVQGETIKPLWEVSDEEWHVSLDTNLSGAFYCCRAVGRSMTERKSGKVINISSLDGVRGVSGRYTYSAAKAGLINFTQSLALNWARYGINVNCIAPGTFHTWRPQEDYDFILRYIPMGRTGQTEEIGPLAVFLASEASSYMTGAVISIEGGRVSAGYAPLGYVPAVTLETGG